MNVRHHTDASRFLEHAGPVLRADVPRNQLILGIAEQVVDQPDIYPEYHGWVIDGKDGPVAFASCTPPYKVVLGDAVDLGATAELVAAVSQSGVAVAGVLGNRPSVEVFADVWARVVGQTSEEEMGQGVFALTEVAPIDQAPGHLRQAESSDRGLLIGWFRAFHAEVSPGEPVGSTEDGVDQRLDPHRPQGISVWEVDGLVVSMSGYSHPVSNSVRIGPVYTPPASRGRGYATSSVAMLSQEHLSRGRASCLLYTDLANPTSNAIYERIGYRKVAEGIVYRFV